MWGFQIHKAKEAISCFFLGLFYTDMTKAFQFQEQSPNLFQDVLSAYLCLKPDGENEPSLTVDKLKVFSLGWLRLIFGPL